MNLTKKFSYLLLTSILSLNADSIRIMSFNYLESVPPKVAFTADQKRERREFPIRRNLTLRLLKNENPDIIGFQEPHLGDIEFFEKGLVQYKWVGSPIEPLRKRSKVKVVYTLGKAGTDYNPIFYNTKKVKLLQSGTFGLNKELKTGELSTSWNIPSRKSFHVRACTWAQFQTINSQKKFWVFNSHLSLDKPVIVKELELIQGEIIKKAAGEPVILMGDFNNLDYELPQALTTSFVNSQKVAKAYKNKHLGSFLQYNYTIDFILLKNLPQNVVQLYGVVDYAKGYTENNLVPSDHRPIYVDISLP